MAADDAADIGQADAGAFELFDVVQALEHAEQLVHVAHVEAAAVVAHEEVVFVVVSLVTNLDHRVFALAGELDRVGQQVLPYQAQHRRIGLDLRQRCERPLHVAAGVVQGQAPAHILGQRGHVQPHTPQRGAPHLREAEQVIHQCSGGLGRFHDRVQESALGIVQALARRAAQQLGIADNVTERSAQVVADRIGEGFQFLVAAEQLLVQFGHFLGLAQHDIDDGRAHLVCRVAVGVAPRQAALLHGLLPGLERVARGQRHARCCFLAGIATPAHGAHHFRAEPHQVTVMQLRMDTASRPLATSARCAAGDQSAAR